MSTHRTGGYDNTMDEANSVMDLEKDRLLLIETCDQTNHDLKERIKELHCLYHVSEVIRKSNSIELEMLPAIACLIPPAWQFPNITCARIIWNGNEFTSANFRKTAWSMTVPLIVNNKKAGSLEVYYLVKKTFFHDGPFLPEESSLLNTLADILGSSIEKKLAEERLKKSLEEKEILLRELQHRVKNNLNVIISILDLEKAKLKNTEDKDIFLNAQIRIQSMSRLYEHLYSGQNIDSIELNAYIREFTHSVFDLYDFRGYRFCFLSQSKLIQTEMARAVPLGLIVSELISNALKHAFIDSKEGSITIEISSRNNMASLTVTDNGRGLPQGFDPYTTESMGFTLIRQLTEQIEGSFTYDSQQGFSNFMICFPLG